MTVRDAPAVARPAEQQVSPPLQLVDGLVDRAASAVGALRDALVGWEAASAGGGAEASQQGLEHREKLGRNQAVVLPLLGSMRQRPRQGHDAVKREAEEEWSNRGRR